MRRRGAGWRAAEGNRASYVDNGDGTISDTVTGLMWEKLSDDGSIHDWDDTYVWYNAFGVKLPALNEGSFAGYSDWRLPNRFELESLLQLENLFPAVATAFNDGCTPGCTVVACSCTPSTDHWTSTTNHTVRAVRGGL